MTQDDNHLTHTHTARTSNPSFGSRKGSGVASDGVAAHIDEKWGHNFA